MHLYFLTRGIKGQVEQWEKFMQSQFFNFPRRRETTKRNETIAVQGALRPIQLWEFVFPKDCLQDVLLNMKVNPKSPEPYAGWDKYSVFFRKLLKAKEIPKIDVEPGSIISRPLTVAGVVVHPIGIKEDEEGIIDMGPDGKWFQEKL